MGTGVQVWSQTPNNNATADSNVNWAEGMAPSAVNDSARAVMASVARWRDDNVGTLVTSGSSAAFTLVTNQVESALTSGYTVAFTFHAPSDAGATLAVDSLAAKPLQIYPGENLLANQFRAGSSSRWVYSSTGTGQWIAQTPSQVQSVTNVLAANVTLNTTGYIDGPKITQGTSGVGIWFVSGQVTVYNNTAPTAFLCRIADSTSTSTTSTVASGNGVTFNSNQALTIHLSGISVAPSSNLRIQASTNVTGTTNIMANFTGNGADSAITAIRIG